jgi:hypothetical protein
MQESAKTRQETAAPASGAAHRPYRFSGSLIQLCFERRLDCPLPDWLTSPCCTFCSLVFITSSDQGVVAHNLEYESLLSTPNDIESDGFIIDPHPLHRDALCLLVDRFKI